MGIIELKCPVSEIQDLLGKLSWSANSDKGNEFQDIAIKIIQWEEKEKKKCFKRKIDSVIYGQYQVAQLIVTGVTEREQKKNEAEKNRRNNEENVSNLVKAIKLQEQKKKGSLAECIF